MKYSLATARITRSAFGKFLPSSALGMSNPAIVWEYSAQRRDAPPNPLVEKSISYLETVSLRRRNMSNLRVADQGCGSMRHLGILQRWFKKLFFIETALQIQRNHKI